MALPSLDGTQAEGVESAWASARSTGSKLKRMATQLKAASLAGPVKAQQILDFLAQLHTQRTRLATIQAIDGLDAYVVTRHPLLVATTEIGGVIAGIDAIVAWMVGAFPSNGTYILQRILGGDGLTSDRDFSTAQLAGLRTQLDALLATID